MAYKQLYLIMRCGEYVLGMIIWYVLKWCYATWYYSQWINGSDQIMLEPGVWIWSRGRLLQFCKKTKARLFSRNHIHAGSNTFRRFDVLRITVKSSVLFTGTMLISTLLPCMLYGQRAILPIVAAFFAWILSIALDDFHIFYWIHWNQWNSDNKVQDYWVNEFRLPMLKTDASNKHWMHAWMCKLVNKKAQVRFVCLCEDKQT